MGKQNVHIQFWFKSMKERDHFEDLGRYGKIILKCRTVREHTDLIHLIQNRQESCSPVRTVMTLWFHSQWRIY